MDGFGDIEREQGPSWARENWPLTDLDEVNAGLDPTLMTIEKVAANAKDLAVTAKDIPADRLLIETDAPFLAPVPHRGRPCEPAFVADTARFLAQLRGEPVDALAEYTTANFHTLFSKAA